MKTILAAALFTGLSVGMADAADKPAARPLFNFDARDDAPTVTPENDARLGKLPKTEARTIGVLTYYRNKGGGYTFLENGHLVFYALPHMPITSIVQHTVDTRDKTDKDITYRFVKEGTASTVGTSTMPFGGQTIYCPQMVKVGWSGVVRRYDIPIATWSRDMPTGKVRLSIMDVDSQTRVKLKSIVPVLETALLADEKSPARKQASPITYRLFRSKGGANYEFFRDEREIAYSNGRLLFLRPSPPAIADIFVLDAGHEGEGWMPAYQNVQPPPFTAAQQNEIVDLLHKVRQPCEIGKRHELVGRPRPTDEFEPPPKAKK
jgi:hypothetical protein